MTLMPARRVLLLVATLLGVLATACLGVWQWHRAEFKAAQQAQWQRLQHAPPWGAANWPCPTTEQSDQAVQASPWAQHLHQPAVLRGHWLAERTVLLDNRMLQGRSGVVVVTPLRLSQPGHACRAQVVLVQRGWLPRDPAAPRDAAHVPGVTTPTGEVTVSGRFMLAASQVYALSKEPVPSVTSRSEPVLLRQNVDAEFWSAWLGQSPLPGALLQVQADVIAGQALASPMQRNWPDPDNGRDKHLAYAVQWFALSALILGLYVWHQLIRPHRSQVQSTAQPSC